MLSKVFGLPEVGQESEGRLGSWVCMADQFQCSESLKRSQTFVQYSNCFCSWQMKTHKSIFILHPESPRGRSFSQRGTGGSVQAL